MTRRKRDDGGTRPYLITDLFQTFAGEVRFAIVRALANSGPMDVNALADTLHESLSNVSRHLGALVECDVVQMNRDRTRHVYSVREGVALCKNGYLHLDVRTGDGTEMTLKHPIEASLRMRGPVPSVNRRDKPEKAAKGRRRRGEGSE